MIESKNIGNPLLKNIYFGLDMFEFNISSLIYDCFFYSSLVWNLDEDNSNYGFINIGEITFTYKKINISGFGDGLIFECSIDGVSIPCFSLLKGKDLVIGKNKGKSIDKIVLYSSFFVLDHLEKLPFTILEFIGNNFNYEKSLLYRLDIALDVPCTIKKLAPLFVDMEKPSSAIGTDKKHPEFYQTYYLGQIQNSNRNYVIRIYDKVLDTWKKGKGFLYPHLKNNTDVRRIELELRPEQAKRFHNISILDIIGNKNNIVSDIFIQYINKKIPEEYHLIKNDLNLKIFSKRKFNLKESYLEVGHIPRNYLVHTYGYIKKVLKNTGYNGFFQLIFNIQYDDIDLKKNIKINVDKILFKSPYDDLLIEKPIKNDTNKIFDGYELLDNLIIYLKKSPLSNKKINRILRKYTSNKIKLNK